MSVPMPTVTTSGARGNVVVHVAPGQADGAMSTAKGSPGAARFSAREREQRRRGCGQDVGGGEPALCPVPHLSLNSPGTNPFRSGRKNGLAFMARCSDRDASRAQIVICKTFGVHAHSHSVYASLLAFAHVGNLPPRRSSSPCQRPTAPTAGRVRREHRSV